MSRSDDSRYKSARWRRLRESVIRRDGRRCSVPGCAADMALPRMTHVDHIIEVGDGGDFWDPSNLRVLCRTHHAAKTLMVMASRGERPSPNA